MKRLVVFIVAISSLFGVIKSNAQVAVGVSVGIAPPAIPVYEQPPCPSEGYLWTPGYWGYGSSGYYWVPGVWVASPRVGFLWTPGYWGFLNGGYYWHAGYWGPHVGFYGGINYGYGYGGRGFYGGRWEGGAFRYNTAVWYTGPGFHNTYVDRTVIVNNNSHTSFNGPRGVTAQPTAAEQSAMRDQHIQATSEQQRNEHSASINRSQLASVNKGRPSTMARSTVGRQRFNSAGHAVNSTHAAPHPANASHAPQPANANHSAPRPANANHAAVHNSALRQQPQHRANPNRGRARPQGGRGGGRERGGR